MAEKFSINGRPRVSPEIVKHSPSESVWTEKGL